MPLFLACITKIKDCLKGLLFYGILNPFRAERHYLDNLLMLGIFGRCIGFPWLFNYHYLRLMPHCVGGLGPWKRKVLKERDFFDRIGD